MQEEYILAKPARDAAAKAKMEAEALSTKEGPLHDDNEWNIRCLMILFIYFFSFLFVSYKYPHTFLGVRLILLEVLRVSLFTSVSPWTWVPDITATQLLIYIYISPFTSMSSRENGRR